MDLAAAMVIGDAFGKGVDSLVSLVMGSLLQPALLAANGHSIATWPAGSAIVALIHVRVIAFMAIPILRSSRPYGGARGRSATR